MSHNLNTDNDVILEEIAALMKKDHGTVYTPRKISHYFNISPYEAEKCLEVLVKRRVIKKLSYGTHEPDFRLYCYEKPDQ